MSPYLAWIPSLAAYQDGKFGEFTDLDPSLILLSFEEYPLIPTSSASTQEMTQNTNSLSREPNSPNDSDLHLRFFSSSDEMQSIIKKNVDALTSEVRQVIDNLQKHPEYHGIHFPEQALFRLKQAYYWNLLPGTVTKTGHILVLAGMKRAVLKLHGFLLWKKDHIPCAISSQSHSHQPKPYGTRGVYLDNLRDYNTVGHFSVAVYMEVNFAELQSRSLARKVQLSPIPIHRREFEHRASKHGHQTYIYFYPPVVEDFSLFEIAGRGYASRLDAYKPDVTVDMVYSKVVKDGRFAKGIYFPYLKCPSHHICRQAQEEYIGIQPFSPIPPLHEWTWSQSQMEWPPAFKGPGRPPAIVTAVLPPLLFFRCSNSVKQGTFFFIWACICFHWLPRLYETPYDSRAQFYLTHQQWRDILSGERFRKAARNTPGSSFDLTTFWKFNTSLFGSGDIDINVPTVRVPGINHILSSDLFLDSHDYGFEFKHILCYDIALTSIKYQFEESDEILMRRKGLSTNAMEKRRHDRSTLFRHSLDLPTSELPWESTKLAIKAAWFESFHKFICDWPKVYEHRSHCDATLLGLPEPLFLRECNILLSTYYTGVIRALNMIPTVMWSYLGNYGIKLFRKAEEAY